jgi:hypothetical protein
LLLVLRFSRSSAAVSSASPLRVPLQMPEQMQLKTLHDEDETAAKVQELPQSQSVLAQVLFDASLPE